MDLAMDVGLIAAVLPAAGPDQGVVPGQADPARGRPVGPPAARAGPAPAPNRASRWRSRRSCTTSASRTRRGCATAGPRFHNHEQVGRAIADRLCRDLKLANAERERMTWLVEYHQYLGEATKLRESKLKRILAEPGIDELLALHRADALASTGDASHVDYCESYLRDQPAGPINPPPLLNGHDLARHGLKSGPQTKLHLEMVREAQLDRLIHSKKEALDWLDRQLARRGQVATTLRPTSAERRRCGRSRSSASDRPRQAGTQREDLAGQDSGWSRWTYPPGQARHPGAGKVPAPGFAVDEEQLTHADLRVEIELLSRSVARADDLDGEVGPAEPVGSVVVGRVPCRKTATSGHR